MLNIEALKALYVKLGGKLTDTYPDIADGVAVGEYSQLADGIAAISKVAGSGGGGGGGDVYIAELGVDMDTGDFTLADFDATYEAAQTKAVVGIANVGTMAVSMPLLSAMTMDDDRVVVFLMMTGDVSTIMFTEGVAAGELHNIPTLPEDPSDGEILVSRGGEWRTKQYVIVNINSSGTSDKDSATIGSALGNGGIVIGFVDNGAYSLSCTQYDGTNAFFSGAFIDGSTLKLKTAIVDGSGNATVTDYTITVS